MKTPNNIYKSAGCRFKEGFTLVELLVVLTIMGIISAATIPTIQSVLQSTGITQGGQTLVEQINLARQIASARNTTVQVRLIKLAQVQNPTATGYTAIQLWGTPSGSSAPIALSRMTILPTSVVVSEDTTNYSKLLAEAVVPSAPLPTMPVPTGTASYIYFSVTPSGVIPVSSVATGESSEMTGAYLSVVPARYGNSGTLPTPGVTSGQSNYLIVQMNPNTGSTLIYRP